jgi:hypothetical protein
MIKRSHLLIVAFFAASSCDDAIRPSEPLGYSTRHVVAGRVSSPSGVVADIEVRAMAFLLPPPPADCSQLSWASASAHSNSDGTFIVLLRAPRFETEACIRVEALRSGNVVATNAIPVAQFRLQTSPPDTSFVALTLPN